MKKDINKTECKIQSCKGKYNCLEHCPCDCHSPAEVKKDHKCDGKSKCMLCDKKFEPAELNLASQDWEERFLMATIYQEDSGFQKFGEGEPTKWKTDWDKVKQFIEKEISLARTEAVAEYKAELLEKI